jgi:hypothetical protein
VLFDPKGRLQLLEAEIIFVYGGICTRLVQAQG